VKPFIKGQKTTSATPKPWLRQCSFPTVRCSTKSVDQLDLQALHRVRSRLVSQRTVD
jgi:transposase